MSQTLTQAPPIPVVSYDAQSVQHGLCHLASHAAGYVRLGALKTLARMLDMFPRTGKFDSGFPPDDPHHQIPEWHYEETPVALEKALKEAEAAAAKEAAEAEAGKTEESSEDEEEPQSSSDEDDPP